MTSKKKPSSDTLHSLVEETLNTLNALDLDTIPDSVKKELINHLNALTHAVNLASAQVEEEIKMMEAAINQTDGCKNVLPLKTRAYEKIMVLQGMNDLKKLAAELCKTASAKQKTSNVFLPNIFLVNEPGAGTTTFIRLLAKLLDELGLFQFRGVFHSMEFTLHDETDYDHLHTRLQTAAGFSNSFRGVVALDIASYKGNIEMLTRITKKLKENCLLVFCVRTDTPKLRDFFYAATSGAPFEIMTCLTPNDQEMTAYMVEQLGKFGCQTTDSARALMCSYIASLRESSGFHGFTTVASAAWVVAHYCGSPSEIGPEQFQAFLDSEYSFERRLELHSPVKIGFR